MGWLGAIGRTTGHSRLTGFLTGAERRRSLRMVVTMCTFFGVLQIWFWRWGARRGRRPGGGRARGPGPVLAG
jgi:hypothetical protein